MHGIWALTLRSLRIDARLVKYHWLRAGAPLIAWVVLWCQDMSPMAVSASGRQVLLVLLGLNLYLVTLGGVLLFAPVLSEEKETGNLGLLRMTGIGPAAVVLGCSLPRLMQLGLILVTQLPILGLTVMLGGVTWSHVWAAVMLVFFQMIFVAGLGVLCSVFFQTSGKSVAAALLLTHLWGQVNPRHASLSIAGYFESFRQSTVLPEGLLTVTLIHGLLALICVGTATALLDRAVQRESGDVPSALFPGRFRTRRVDTSPPASSSGPREEPSTGHSKRTSVPVWNHPLAWKEFHFLGGGWLGFRLQAMIVFCCIVGLSITYWSSPHYAGQSMMSLALWFLGVELVYLSVNLVGPEIRNQTWESLRILPISIGSLCKQKCLGAARHLIPWLLLWCLGIVYSGTARRWLEALFEDPLTSLFVMVHYVVHPIAFALTLVRTSLSFNPWIAILVSSVVYGVIGVLLGTSALITFGIFGPPATKMDIVIFNLFWIPGLLFYSLSMAQTIQKRLETA